MGACCSQPSSAKYEAPAGSSKSTSKPTQPKPTKPSVPDFGLSGTHEVIKLLGRGGEGETWLCRDKQAGTEVAIKLIKRPIPKPAIQVIKREIKIQADLGQGHLNIVSADEVILSKSHLGLIMEYVPGGNMVGYVTKKRETKSERAGLCLDEDEARYFFRQLISAVEYCHRNNVAHRDLKLDNTLLDNHDPAWLKLCDFGFAKHWQANSNMDTMRIGTPEYMGPELISSRTGYDGKKVDVWAAGVLLYVMLVGMFPFETQDDNFNNTAGLYDIWLQQIKTSWREVPNNTSAASRLSPELKDLLDKMFHVKQESRASIDTIKAHPWFNKPLPAKFEESLKVQHLVEELEEEQLVIDEQVSKGAFHSAERDKALEALLDRAVVQALPTEEVTRLSLSKIKRAYSILKAKGNGAAMAAVAEEE
ncbi:hypothetical protein VOLCADRAFT_118773 [Volvox carteri f. nagariensis]|uniref:Protein kinase domain-containing protein n=1 Tax=Volvox carteri f. nagariensis TaxID=3068 RepID=D8U7C2_VOLCA|nr:uncharacterized protein VOLCADRAFT_118773 [Volvox carteri f. nagariensis]EFJ44395.1 hypothetical protein VOLCADRAFT_118773 [Volvox carteri f. nagariensis]|eukprot:XP_002954502.1 hypothetical protein VOLCADRAFT_118773 [Volvox carteri f. nagariensis]